MTRSRVLNGYGNAVVIDHGEGWTSLYGHMQSASPLVEGQSVGAGSYVGPVGTTGNSTGPHLHLQLELDAIPRDPSPLIENAPLAPITPIEGDNDLTPDQDARLKNIEAILATENSGGIRQLVRDGNATSSNVENILARENSGGIRAVALKARDNAQAALDVTKNVESILAVESGGGIRAIVRAIRTKVGA